MRTLTTLTIILAHTPASAVVHVRKLCATTLTAIIAVIAVSQLQKYCFSDGTIFEDM